MSAVVPPPGCPAHAPVGRHARGLPRLYGEAFAADPLPTYTALWQRGPVAEVELAPGVPALVTTTYAAALEVTRRPEVFRKDARLWRALADGEVPADSPVLPMMIHRPSCLFADGPEHTRLRRPLDAAWAQIDPHALRRGVEATANALIDRFTAADGGSRVAVDLVGAYAERIPPLVFAALCGAPRALVERMATACAAMIDASGATAARGSADLAACLAELVALKRRAPGPDVTSWMIQHPARLTDEELVHQHVVLIGAGTVPTSAWISSVLWLLLTDRRFAGDLSGGSLTVEHALHEVLHRHSPMASYSMHYAVQDTTVQGVPVPAGVPLLIGHAMGNLDPALGTTSARELAGNRAHLAWSAGPHRCPARSAAEVMVGAAVEAVLDRLPDMELAVGEDELSWRPGPFHRALRALPVTAPAPAPSPVYGGQR